jgi:hypothetical protein
MNSQTKIIFLIFAGLVLAYLLYASQSSQTNLPTQELNEAETKMDHFEPSINTAVEHFGTGDAAKDNIVIPSQADYSAPEVAILDKKFMSKNRATEGNYKRSSYNEGKRGNLGQSDWQNFYDHNNNIIGQSENDENDKFLPNDEAGDGFAVFRTNKQETCGSNQDCSPEELFDAQKYLPQEVNDDWFELVPEAISVKNRHLINITKPIGVNTIGSSKKNASHDLRGAPSCPKFVVSPFLNSSIEPDNNLKPL